MKPHYLFLALLLYCSAVGQTKLSITQDPRLAFVGDDKGNTAFTTNITARLTQDLWGEGWVLPLAYVEYEYADLRDPFNKIGLGFGLRVDYLIKDVEFTVLYGVNKTYRSYGTFANWDLVGNVGYKIASGLEVIAELQQTKRNDIKKQPFIYSGKLGLRFTL